MEVLVLNATSIVSIVMRMIFFVCLFVLFFFSNRSNSLFLNNILAEMCARERDLIVFLSLASGVTRWEREGKKFPRSPKPRKQVTARLHAVPVKQKQNAKDVSTSSETRII